MSSAILYLAIVAIWAVVLVPRWLRPRSAQPHPAEHVPDLQQQAERQPGKPQFAERQPVERHPVEQRPVERQPVAAQPATPDPPPADVDWPEPADPGAGPVPAFRSPTARRADILRARRRMLATIVALTAGAVGLAVTGMAASWVIIPPAVLLAGFLVLLREAARFDAERARATQIRRAAGFAVAGQEPESVRQDVQPQQVPETGVEPVTAELASATEPPSGAEVIDISGRIGDQVYDQYADAADRAVGD